ncbi:hypothetical protein FA95DRAFT_1603863 [Auriscalpium vulgare]|uniref:Uncharacterized protein n=1 Tax=Auriscalpium vulgare TaxID=40419 RepID=A0ACB8S2C7_9AGAM|nr:hypothetical protein FA95DRAFT_1603863 [Auriscalpium vulgare]
MANLEVAFRILAFVFTSLTAALTVMIVKETVQTPSAFDPSLSEWSVCWPLVVWRVGWHICLAINVCSLTLLFRRSGKPTLVDPRLPALLFLWFAGGIGLLFFTGSTCSVGAPHIWQRTLELLLVAACGIGSMVLVIALAVCVYTGRRLRSPALDAEGQQLISTDSKTVPADLMPFPADVKVSPPEVQDVSRAVVQG